MKHTLIIDDLWPCVEGTPPIDPHKDMHALARISLAVKPCCIQYLRDTKTAKQPWDKLRIIFEDKGFTKRVMLFKKATSR